MNNPVSVLLDQVVADLDRVLADDGLAGLDDAARMDVLRVAGEAFRRVEAVVVETVATADRVAFCDRVGCRNVNDLLQRTVLVDAQVAAKFSKVIDAVRRDVNLVSGERLPARWPAVREALLDGVVGVTGVLAAISAVDAAGDRIGVQDRWRADVFLARHARGVNGGLDGDTADALDGEGSAPAGPSATPEDLRRVGQWLAMVMDPDGAEPADLNAQHRRYLTVGPLREGVHAVKGSLLPEVAAQLRLITDAMLNPKVDGPPVPGVRFMAEGDDPGAGAGAGAGRAGEDPFNSDPRAVIDSRTPAQKRHDVLAAALGIAARHEDMPSLGGAAPTLVVTVDAMDLAEGLGWATVPGSDAPVPISVATQTACTGAIQRVLFDEGRIVGITSTDRVFTAHQRRAIVARDRECLIPGCHVPASWCEIHHVTEHARGGPTHTDNGVPLCWWHHRSLDRSGWEIRMNDGVPQVRGPAWWDPAERWHTPRPSTLGSGMPGRSMPGARRQRHRTPLRA